METHQFTVLWSCQAPVSPPVCQVMEDSQKSERIKIDTTIVTFTFYKDAISIAIIYKVELYQVQGELILNLT